MESQSLRTASTYINNLLLSRGLLRNGIPVEFASPMKAEGGLDGTMAKIMNLVHDLILRRDRESDALSTLSHTLHAMRTSFNHQNQAITRLENHNGDLERQLALTISQEKAARGTLKSAETRTKALREEMARLKSTVTQIRGQCANDVRRRDGEIQKLKRHLEGRRGREGNGGQIGVVVITPGINKTQLGSRQMNTEVDLESPEYSLKQETTEFLTQLSQGLSDENDALIGLVRSTLATLRSLQGLPTQSSEELEQINYGTTTTAAPPSYEELASNIDEVLEHLRDLLTNPSFVPLEEVEVREDEIIRLRDGWEKMETRWKEAVALMDGWRKRMVDTGDTIKLEDLRLGLNIGSEIPSMLANDGASIINQETEEEEDFGGSSLKEVQDDAEEPSEVDLVDELSTDELETPIVTIKDTPPPPQKSSSNDILSPKTRGSKILSPRSPNARPKISHKTSLPSPKNSFFPAIPEENTKQLLNFDEQISIPWFSPLKTASIQSSGKPPHRPARQSHHQSSSPLNAPDRTSPRTIAQKLATAQAEAEDTRKREANNPKKKPEKKFKTSRRRSTLSPEELERLMGCL